MNDADEAVLSYIRHVIRTTNVPPTVRAICEQFGWSSPSTVHARLRRLEREGLLEFRVRGRGYWPADSSRCPTCGLTS